MRRAPLAALAAVLALTACSGGAGDSDGAATGDLVAGRPGELAGAEHVVQLPSGQVRITLGKPADAVGERQAADGHRHEAPNGAAWVGVDWHFEPGAGLTPFERSLTAGDAGPRTTLGLSVGERAYPLGDVASSTSTPADARTSGIVYLALPTGANPVLTVDLDGTTARVDTGTGQVSGELAAAYADPRPTRSGACDGGAIAGGTARVACTYTALTVPYLPGRGWSERGWTVAQVETRVDGFERAGSRYATASITDASRLTGAAGSEREDVTSRLTTLVARVVAQGPADRLEVVRRVAGTKLAGRGPDTASVTYRLTVPLGAGAS